MLKKIRIKIAILISTSCFSIILLMSSILLYSSYNQIFSNAMSEFKLQTTQLTYDISDIPNFNAEKLINYQNNKNICIFIYENQQLTNFSQKFSNKSMIDFSKAILNDNYNVAQKNLETEYINHTEFDAGKKLNNYFYSIILYPGKNSETEIIIISMLNKENSLFINQIKKLSLITGISFVVMFILAFILAGYILRPVKKSQEQQTRFIASASHEIRNPVNTIISALEASEKGTPEDHYYFCNIAKKEGKRLSLLTEELLTIASSNNGSLVYNISDCELDSIIIDCYEAFYAPAKKKNINFNIELPQENVPKFKADPERIKQVINIFLSNAVYFTKDNGDITLSYSFDNEWHKIIVSDNGPGITDEEKEHIFEAFYRADSSGNSTSHFGLGLSIAKGIIDHHNGFIKVENNKPCGTIFIITFPISSEKK